ncbi:MAG: hypothetical protein IT167_29515 [Bryobacterales bacterium]|nr:hypothetical protein [Bryobacterales bacterium]
MMCTAEQIQSLLRLHKGSDGVRITAENKEALVSRNLRDAVDAKVITEEQVNNLIRGAEENGGQHIFYFRCTKAYGAKLSLNLVAENLWGKNWATKMQFPRYELKENDFVWADARQWSPEKKPRDWTLKVYGDEVHHRFLGESHEDGKKLLVRKYAVEQKRRVLLARWNDPDILELRVPSDESRRRVLGWVQKLWNMLQTGLQRSEFKEWDLTKARSKMVAEAKANSKYYTTRDTVLLDPNSNAVEFHPHSAQGDLFASDATTQAIDGLLKANSGCIQTSTTWLARDGVLSKDLRTYIGGMSTNELIVREHCEARDLDYVTDQLRFHSR